GFELPADWPIPQGYVHPAGTLLKVPDGWTPAQPTQLPGSFEQPFALANTGGTVTFTGSAEGDITLIKHAGGVAFARDGFLTTTVPADGSITVSLAEGEHLVAPFGDLTGITVAGVGTVNAVGTEGNDTINLSAA